jgi:hypothetical protein
MSKSKWRILKITECEECFYILQKRGFFRWISIVDGGCDDLGTYEYLRKFKSEDECISYYKKHEEKCQSKEIIKEW